MVIHIARGGRSAALWTDATRVRLYEGPTFALAKETPCADPPAECAKILARRAKSGWVESGRVESPWQAWLDDLPQLLARIGDDAAAASARVTSSSIQLSYPQRPKVDDEWCELESVSSLVRVRVGVERAGTSFDEQLELSVPARDAVTIEAWRSGVEPLIPFYRRMSPRTGEVRERGLVDRRTGTLTIRDGEGQEVATLEHAAAFRAFLPRYLRDDIIGFALAELGR